MSEVKIISGWTNPGGSTVAHINLCNLFNANGIDCTLYGRHEWHADKCRSGFWWDMNSIPEDTVILHYVNIAENPNFKKYILSCHETNMYPIKNTEDNTLRPNLDQLDGIHYVSKLQKDWHGVNFPSVVIPNVVSKLTPKKVLRLVGKKRAGVIGSIDSHKQTHLSIKRALDDGYENVLIYGKQNDPLYFESEIVPLLKGGVVGMGHEDDKQKMYDSVDIVYHSSVRETYNYVRAECTLADVEYNGLESADGEPALWSDEELLDAWTSFLEIE
tara:strand:+ start:46 stop:864 length:819 start_codon:yes stop_codon:yes gene_type:complete